MVTSKSVLQDSQKPQKAHTSNTGRCQLQVYNTHAVSKVQGTKNNVMLTFGPNTCLSSMAATIQHLMA